MKTILSLRKIFALSVLFVFSLPMSAQTVRVELGWAGSSMRYHNPKVPSIDFFGSNANNFQCAVAVDYLNYRWFDLTSEIGYIRKGGKEKDILTDAMGISQKGSARLNLDYLTLNTMFNVKYDFNGITPYIGVGPRLDFKVGSSESYENLDLENPGNPLASFHSNAVIFGWKCAAGVRVLISPSFQVGLHFSYLPSFTDAYRHKETGVWLRDGKNFTLGVSLGYVIR